VFKTTEQSALFPSPTGPDGIQFWAHIEHEILWPWYYLQVVQDFGSELMRTMVMVSTPSELAGVVSARTATVWLEAAYIATPGDINGTDAWKLEPLLQAVMYRDEQGALAGVTYTVVSTKVYAVGEPSDERDMSTETIFDSTIHLGQMAAP
jgi:hypothetical protein